MCLGKIFQSLFLLALSLNYHRAGRLRGGARRSSPRQSTEPPPCRALHLLWIATLPGRLLTCPP
jgi:hypothetical protein